MPEDILAAVQSKKAPVDFMTAAYANGRTLSYSLDISVAPLINVLADPALSEVADLAFLSADQLSILSQNKKTEYGADYTFEADESAMIAGKTALALTARLAETNGYTTKIYLIADKGQLFTITMLYQEDSSNAALNQATAVLDTLRFASTPVALQSTASPSVSPSPTATATTAPSSTPTLAPTPVPTSDAGFMGFVDGVKQNITTAYHNDPFFMLYVVGGFVLVALIIIFIVLLCARRRKEKMDDCKDFEVLEDQILPRRAHESSSEEKSSVQPMPQEDAPSVSPTAASVQENNVVHSVPARPTIAEAYSQQQQTPKPAQPKEVEPPAQAVPVSSKTPSETVSALDPSRPKVGSRMDRHQDSGKKKKKK